MRAPREPHTQPQAPTPPPSLARSLVGSYLKTAFPRAAITLRNGAVGATPSALMEMCLENYVDEGIDLVFVEFTANDGEQELLIPQCTQHAAWADTHGSMPQKRTCMM